MVFVPRASYLTARLHPHESKKKTLIEHKEDNLRHEDQQCSPPCVYYTLFFFHFIPTFYHLWLFFLSNSFFLFRFHLLYSLPPVCLTPFSRRGSGRALRWRVGESLCVSDVKRTSGVIHRVFSALVFISLFREHERFGSGIHAIVLVLIS